LAVLVGKDGKEVILKASDCTFALIGDSQEEDRRTIADIVSARMQVNFITFFTSSPQANCRFHLLERLSSTTPEITISTRCELTRSEPNRRKSTNVGWNSQHFRKLLATSWRSASDSRKTNARRWFDRSSRQLEWRID
jgi:hypothetical protein